MYNDLNLLLELVKKNKNAIKDTKTTLSGTIENINESIKLKLEKMSRLLDDQAKLYEKKIKELKELEVEVDKEVKTKTDKQERIVQSNIDKMIAKLTKEIDNIKKEVVSTTLKGDKGEKGDPGKPGIPGLKGKNGTDGRDGKNGINGLNGLDGKTPVFKYVETETLPSGEPADVELERNAEHEYTLKFKIPRGKRGIGGSGGDSVQEQADWEQKDESQLDYIKNKPTHLSQFINDLPKGTKFDILESDTSKKITLSETPIQDDFTGYNLFIINTGDNEVFLPQGANYMFPNISGLDIDVNGKEITITSDREFNGSVFAFYLTEDATNEDIFQFKFMLMGMISSSLLSGHFGMKLSSLNTTAKNYLGAVNELKNNIDNIELIPGPEGPQGPQGIQGPQGPQGIPGAQGAPGEIPSNVATLDGAETFTGQKWFENTSIPVYMKRKTNNAGTYAGFILERETTTPATTPPATFGIGAYLKAKNTDKLTTHTGLFGGRLVPAIGGESTKQIGEVIFSPSWEGEDPWKKAELRLRAISSTLSNLYLTGDIYVNSPTGKDGDKVATVNDIENRDSQKVQSLGNITGAKTIDLLDGRYVKANLTGNVNLTFIGLPATNYIKEFTLAFTGNKTITLPTSTKYVGGVMPRILSNSYEIMGAIDSLGVITIYGVFDDISEDLSLQGGGMGIMGFKGGLLEETEHQEVENNEVEYGD